MAATTEDGKKVDEVVAGEKSNNADEVVVGEKSNTGDDAVGETSKMITLKSSDGESFEVTHEAAALSKTIHNMIEEDCVENGVRFPNLNSQILSKVLEYCNKHAASASSDSGAAAGEQEDLKSFDKNFVEVDQATLFDIICAANYLAVEGLLDLTCQKVADIIKGKTVEQIREYFNIENDFTPEEEAEIRKENQWAFE